MMLATSRAKAKAKPKQRQPAQAQVTATEKAQDASIVPLRANTRPTGRPRLRRAIDTNVAAYDRKDPYAAVDALRKLLGALPARVGAAQLRMTPDEHALAMHLLVIVEPFVQPNPPSDRLRLARQPTEILDEIALHVDERTDLLALALSCKRLHAVVCPRHIEYRVLRAKASNVALWAHLTANRALAANVRRLEVLDERAVAAAAPAECGRTGVSSQGRVRIPSDVVLADTDLDSSGSDSAPEHKLVPHAKQGRLFAAALARMTRLTAVVWACNHSLVSLHDVWPTLLKCRELSSAEINDNAVFCPMQEEQGEQEDGAGQTVMPRLSSVVVRSFKKGFGQSKTPELTRINNMLYNCPRLEELTIAYMPHASPGTTGAPARPRADALLTYGRWAGLRALTLTNVAALLSVDLVAFLAAHSQLEVLHVVGMRAAAPATVGVAATGNTNATADVGADANGAGGEWTLPPGVLPCLRELRCDPGAALLVHAVLRCPMAQSAPGSQLTTEPASATLSVLTPGRPLETLAGVRLDVALLAALEHDRGVSGNTHALRRVELIGYADPSDLRRLAACVPRLEWLDVGRRIGAPGGGGARGVGPVSNVADWADLLALLPALTTLHGVRFFHALDAGASSDASNSGFGFGSASSSMAMSTSPAGASARSRARKNDEVAAVLTWRAPRLRRVDHWDAPHAGGRVVVLVRDRGREAGTGEHAKVRWEVRRVKA